MKTLKKAVLLALVYFLASYFPVFAETISGQVEESDPATGKLTVSGTDVWVNANTSFSGGASLADIKKGDSVSLKVSTDSEGNKEASSVSRA